MPSPTDTRGLLRTRGCQRAGYLGAAHRHRWLRRHRRAWPAAQAVPVQSWRQFQAYFGDFTGAGYLAYAVRAFFENGGRRCWVVRVASEAAATAETILRGPPPSKNNRSPCNTISGALWLSVPASGETIWTSRSRRRTVPRPWPTPKTARRNTQPSPPSPDSHEEPTYGSPRMAHDGSDLEGRFRRGCRREEPSWRKTSDLGA